MKKNLEGLEMSKSVSKVAIPALHMRQYVACSRLELHTTVNLIGLRWNALGGQREVTYENCFGGWCDEVMVGLEK